MPTLHTVETTYAPAWPVRRPRSMVGPWIAGRYEWTRHWGVLLDVGEEYAHDSLDGYTGENQYTLWDGMRIRLRSGRILGDPR